MSITLDKFVQIECPVYSDPSDPRVRQWCRHWESRPGFDRLDTIRVTEPEADKFVDPLREMKMDSVTLMEQPALREFELVVRDSIPSMNMTVVRHEAQGYEIHRFSDAGGKTHAGDEPVRSR